MIGALNKRVAVQKAEVARDSNGGFYNTWTTVVERWASIEPAAGNERIKAQQVTSEVTHKIRMYYYALGSNDRLLYGVRVFNVLSILDVKEDEKFIDVLCKEIESTLLPVVNDSGETVYNDSNQQVYTNK